MNVIAVCEKQQTNQFSQQEVSVPDVKMRDKPQVLKFKPPEDGEKQYSSQSRVKEGVVPAVLKVISAGGGGGNALNRMIDSNLYGVEFIAVNTDIQDLCDKSRAKIKLQIGAKVTGGRGSGGIPEKGERAAIEDKDAIAEVLKGADMVFVTACMCGGTGTGSAPIIAKIAKDMGALTVAVVTMPFEFEGRYRMRQAEEGIVKLREAVDTLIIIPNEHLFKLIDNKTSYDNAFLLADDVLCRGVQGISELIIKSGFKNTDFADVETIMKGKGDALMGIGYGTGDNRAIDAVKNAIDNPLLEDTNIEGATGVLINIAGPADITLVEIQSIIRTIKDKCDPDVNLIHGIREDTELGGSIQITVIATGFSSTRCGGAKSSENAKPKDSDFIKIEEFIKFRDRTRRPEYLEFLPQKDFQDDLDVPSVIRNHNYQADEKSCMDKAENG